MTTSTGLMKKAQAAFASGNLKNSEKLCRKLLRDHQVQLPVRALLAQTLIKQNRLEEAADFAIEAAEMDQSNIGLQTTTGDLLESLKKYDEAFPFYQRVLASQPENSAHWRKLLSNMHKSAMVGSGATTSTDEGHSAVTSGNTLQGIPEALILLSSKALKTFPDDSALVTLIGEIYFDAGQKQAAEMCFEHALANRPIVTQAHHNWLKLQHESKAYQQIVDYAAKHGKAAAKNPLCMRVIASAYEYLGKDLLGLEYIQNALALAPANPEYIGARGRTHIHLGDYKRAREDLESAIQIDPDEPVYRSNLRIAFQGLGLVPDAAREEFSRLKTNSRALSYDLTAPHWQDQSLSGKRLLVWSEQGIGDVFKFCTLIYELPVDCHPIILGPKKTIGFLKAAFPLADVREEPKTATSIKSVSATHNSPTKGSSPFISRSSKPENISHEKIKEDCDYQIPMGMLYCNLRSDLEDFRKKVRPFELPLPAIKRFSDLDIMSDDDCTRVGIAWVSRAKAPINEQMYLTPEALLPIFKLPGFKFFNFQYTLEEKDVEALRNTYDIPLYHAPGLDLFNDMLGTAAFSSCMDLFVGPSSTSSDIAGSMGVRSFRYHLSKNTDSWGQDHMPWYADQRCKRILPHQTGEDIIPEMKDWLLANKSHRGKYREL